MLRTSEPPHYQLYGSSVPFDPEVHNRACGTVCANFGFGTLVMSQTDTRADIPSVVERTRALDFGSPVVSAHFLADKPVFVLGEEALIWVEPEGEPRRIAAHTGAILSAASGPGRL